MESEAFLKMGEITASLCADGDDPAEKGETSRTAEGGEALESCPHPEWAGRGSHT